VSGGAGGAAGRSEAGWFMVGGGGTGSADAVASLLCIGSFFFDFRGMVSQKKDTGIRQSEHGRVKTAPVELPVNGYRAIHQSLKIVVENLSSQGKDTVVCGS
jgi:hypothetical protein